MDILPPQANDACNGVPIVLPPKYVESENAEKLSFIMVLNSTDIRKWFRMNSTDTRKWFGKAAGTHKDWYLLEFDSFVMPNFGVEDDGVFLAHCRAKAGKKCQIPVGKAKPISKMVGPPDCLVEDSTRAVKYQQGTASTGVFSSAASAIYAFGDERAAESVAARAKESIKRSVNRIDFLQQTVSGEVKGWQTEKLIRGDAAAAFDCLATRSPYPTCILMHGSDGSTDHCIATMGNWIFDSNMSHALPLCQASLDQCVDLDEKGVTFKRCVLLFRMIPSKKQMKILERRRKRAREQLQSSDGIGLEKRLKTNNYGVEEE